jgi:hypothetical protein
LSRFPVVALLLASSCTPDVFTLPITVADLAGQGAPELGGDDEAGGTDDLRLAGDDALDASATILDGGDGPIALPAACTTFNFACVPTVNEGDQDLTNTGDISGCHAYHTLTLGQTTVARDANRGFFACADIIVIKGFLNADAKGEDPGAGPGAGGACGSGGSYGGAGDPLSCGGGAVYGDPNHPRAWGSGGGGGGGALGGRGGGRIELAADSISFTLLGGVVSANGEVGAVGAGGGSGGSILLQANKITGSASILARGGNTLGVGGSGGGGRVAVYGVVPGEHIMGDAGGGGGNAAAGTVVIP